MSLLCRPSTSGPLLSLSDEIILIILRYLDTSALVNTFRTCKKLKRICHEKQLWTKIQHPPDDYEAMKVIFRKGLNSKTRALQIRSRGGYGSNRAFRSSFDRSLLSHLYLEDSTRLSQLSTLALINQKLDHRIFNVSKLPKSLKTLKLNGTKMVGVTEEKHFFRDLSTRLEQLEELDVSNCHWTTSHALMSISKCQRLKKLGVVGCRNVGNCIAYISLATRFGFKGLKILDARDSNIGSSEISALSSIQTLEELYFGQYDDLSVRGQPYTNLIGNSDLNNLTGHALRVLDISGYPLSDEILNPLERLPNLIRLDAHFTNLTEDGIRRFRVIKPHVEINRFRDP